MTDEIRVEEEPRTPEEIKEDWEDSLLDVIDGSGALDKFNDWEDYYLYHPMEYIQKHKDFFNANIDAWEKQLREGWHDENITLKRF